MLQVLICLSASHAPCGERSFTEERELFFGCSDPIYQSIHSFLDQRLLLFHYAGECCRQSAGHGPALNSQWSFIAVSSTVEFVTMSIHERTTTCIQHTTRNPEPMANAKASVWCCRCSVGYPTRIESSNAN